MVSTRQRRYPRLGMRMTPEREKDVKVEAASYGMLVAALFDEIWEAYLRARWG